MFSKILKKNARIQNQRTCMRVRRMGRFNVTRQGGAGLDCNTNCVYTKYMYVRHIRLGDKYFALASRYEGSLQHTHTHFCAIW
jgi:hypothetical protein